MKKKKQRCDTVTQLWLQAKALLNSRSPEHALSLKAEIDHAISEDLPTGELMRLYWCKKVCHEVLGDTAEAQLAALKVEDLLARTKAEKRTDGAPKNPEQAGQGEELSEEILAPRTKESPFMERAKLLIESRNAVDAEVWLRELQADRLQRTTLSRNLMILKCMEVCYDVLDDKDGLARTINELKEGSAALRREMREKYGFNAVPWDLALDNADLN